MNQIDEDDGDIPTVFQQYGHLRYEQRKHMLDHINSDDSARSHSSVFTSEHKSETKNEMIDDLIKEIIPTENLKRGGKVTNKDIEVEEVETSNSSVSIQSSSDTISKTESDNFSDLSENAFFNK